MPQHNRKSPPIRVAIFGASGYTGFELVTRLARHQGVHLTYLVAKSAVGKTLNEVFPTPLNFPLVGAEQVDPRMIDLAFLCLPHGAGDGLAMSEAIRLARAGVRVIDLGADFRLQQPNDYQRWYGQTHAHPEWLPRFVYGLSELNRQSIAQARWVANPGCYPTCAALGLMPLLRGPWYAGGRIIIDAKSGISGAGRSGKTSSLFGEVNGNVVPYQLAGAHRHLPELRQVLGTIYNQPVDLIFTPQVVPLHRGMLATLYTPLKPGTGLTQLHQSYQEAYSDEPFIQLLPLGQTANIHHVVGTNSCAMSLHLQGDLAIVISVIDNLVKGASGQAIQNMNLMVGFTETEGLI